MWQQSPSLWQGVQHLEIKGAAICTFFVGQYWLPPYWKCRRSLGVHEGISPRPLPLLSMRSSSPVNSTTSLALKGSQDHLLVHQTLINLTGSSKSYLSSPTYSIGNFIPNLTTQIKHNQTKFVTSPSPPNVSFQPRTFSWHKAWHSMKSYESYDCNCLWSCDPRGL